MFNLTDLKPAYTPPKKKKVYKKKPTFVKLKDPYAGISRILPEFVASNHKDFFEIPLPSGKVWDLETHVQSIKRKIHEARFDR